MLALAIPNRNKQRGMIGEGRRKRKRRIKRREKRKM
jgi:hypothetical protein